MPLHLLTGHSLVSCRDLAGHADECRTKHQTSTKDPRELSGYVTLAQLVQVLFCSFPNSESKLMGSSAQNSSGVHWCRRRVRFNAVSEKVRFGAEPGQVQQGSEEGFRRREALVQSQVRFNRVPKKVPEKVWEALVQSQVRFNRVPRRFRRRFREALAQRCAEPGQVQQGSGEGSRRMGGFGAEPGQGQQGSREGSGEMGGFGARFREALVQSQVRSNGFREGCRSQARSGSFNSRKPS